MGADEVQRRSGAFHDERGQSAVAKNSRAAAAAQRYFDRGGDPVIPTRELHRAVPVLEAMADGLRVVVLPVTHGSKCFDLAHSAFAVSSSALWNPSLITVSCIFSLVTEITSRRTAGTFVLPLSISARAMTGPRRASFTAISAAWVASRLRGL